MDGRVTTRRAGLRRELGGKELVGVNGTPGFQA